MTKRLSSAGNQYARIDHFQVQEALSSPLAEESPSSEVRVPPFDTSLGALLTTENAVRHLEAAERAQQAKAAHETAKRQRKTAQTAKEQPIIDVLAVSMVDGLPIRPITATKSPTVAQMMRYIKTNPELSTSKLKSRHEMVHYLLDHIVSTTSGL